MALEPVYFLEVVILGGSFHQGFFTAPLCPAYALTFSAHFNSFTVTVHMQQGGALKRSFPSRILRKYPCSPHYSQ
jgi:hypothetical protein